MLRASDSKASGPSSAQHVDMKDVSNYAGMNLTDYITEALPGKPSAKIDKIVSTLASADIDTVEDLCFLAKIEGTYSMLTAWLQKNASLQSVTCMRVARFLYE